MDDLARIRAGGTPQPAEYRMISRAGAVVWLRDEVTIIRDDSGQPQYLYGILADITLQKQLEAELEAAKRQLAEFCKPQLDAREAAILQLLYRGLSNPQIARQLSISERSVRYCLKALCTKLGVSKRAEVLRAAIGLRLLEG